MAAQLAEWVVGCWRSWTPRRCTVCVLGSLVCCAAVLQLLWEWQATSDAAESSSFEGPCALFNGVVSPSRRAWNVDVPAVASARARAPAARRVSGSSKANPWDWWHGTSVAHWEPPAWWEDVAQLSYAERSVGWSAARPLVRLQGGDEGRDPTWLQGWLQVLGLRPSRWASPQSCMRQVRDLWSSLEAARNGSWARALASWELESTEEARATRGWGGEWAWAAQDAELSPRARASDGERAEELCARLSSDELDPWRLNASMQLRGDRTEMRRGLGGWIGALREYSRTMKASMCFGETGRSCRVSTTRAARPLALLHKDERPGSPVCFGRCAAEEGWSVYVGPTDLSVPWLGDAGGLKRFYLIGSSQPLLHLSALWAGRPNARATSHAACPRVHDRLDPDRLPCFVLAAPSWNHSFAAALARRGVPLPNAVTIAAEDQPCVAMCTARASCTAGKISAHIPPSAPIDSPYFSVHTRAQALECDPTPDPEVVEAAAAQQSLLWTSHAVPTRGFRVGFDIAIPLPVANARGAPRPPDVPPALLLSFMGQVYLRGDGAFRQQLARLHNGRDVVVVLQCHQDECDTWQGANYAAMGQGIGPSLYQDLMELSWFCLVPAGRSPASFRLMESLHSGCLPVLVFDESSAQEPWVPPLIEYVPWEEFSVVACLPRLQEQIIHPFTGDERCMPYEPGDLGLWPSRPVPIAELVRVLRLVPLFERLRRRELLLRFYARYLRADPHVARRDRHFAEVNRPLLLATRILHDRLHQGLV